MTAALALVLAACSSASSPVSNTSPSSARPETSKAELCDRVVDHIIDLELANAGASSPEQRRAVKDAKSEELTRACVDKMPRARLECALAARDLAALARCDS